MSETSLIISAFGLLCLVVGAGTGYWLAGFQKQAEPNRTHATLLMTPGSTLDLVRHHGEQEIVVAKVVLSNVTRSTTGTTALFEDHFKWQERNR